MKLVGTTLASLIIASMFGCAATPPSPELVDARTGYARAQTGPAKAYTPAELETARQALEKAEYAYKDDPGSQKAKDLAYIASRKVMLAEVRGRIAQEEKSRTDADEAFKTAAQQELTDKNSMLQNQNEQLNMEQQARRNAEQRAHDALDRLSALAAVKEDTRGTVITLSGSVLFATNKSDLLPGASERLNQVADALKEQPDRDVTVFGFTDSQGNDAYNQSLSEKRAASVRSYLIEHGVSADKIKSVGKGKADPVADNASAEGRANNRRVEIVIGAAQQQSTQQPMK